MRIAAALFLLPLLLAADPLDDALARAGFAREDLGWTPRGWWSRYPRAAPYRLDHFDDLFAEPLATVPFTRTLGRTAARFLAPAEIAKAPEKQNGALYQLAYGLGVERKFGGFRPYSANLTAPEATLDQAILEVHRQAGRQTRFFTFGQESPYPLLERDAERAAQSVPPGVSKVLGRLVLNLLDAHRYARLAFRNVPSETRHEACRRLDLGAETVDALEYAPAVEDVARQWDEASLWYAGLKCVEALDEARRSLPPESPPFTFDWETPLGWIRVRGSGADVVDARDAFLLVDLGGDDRYEGPAGASAPGRLVGAALDLSGDDRYVGGDAAQGAGVGGVGVLVDAAGNDRYEAVRYAQGAGQFGFGALFDLQGNDRYEARFSAQGCGYFGIGLLCDAEGRDGYLLHADGQGFGGVGGVGVLADGAGNDTYFAEPDPAKSERPSYHSEGKVSVSNAQGCAMGRRGDGADGHSWSGGLGALVDVAGNDRYTAGNWCHGTGYWFGTGLLWDGGGDDAYRGAVWSQATGAHFCIGVLLDEAGNDTHVASATNSVCFAHDFAITLHLDAAGDDLYEATAGDGMGFSINRSFAFLVDTGGNDVYRGKEGNLPGFARYDDRFADHEGLSTYFADASSLGLFLDVGGKDTYWNGLGDGAAGGDEPGSKNRDVRNAGVRCDVGEGEIDWRALPVRGRRR